MKKVISFLLILITSLTLISVPTDKVYAADLSMSVSKSEISIGDTVKVTVSVPNGITATVDVYFPTNMFEVSSASGTNNIVGGTVSTTLGEPFASSIEIVLKAKTSGTATVKAVAVKAGDNNNVDEMGIPTAVQLGDAQKNITIANEVQQPEPTKSADNSLKSLKLTCDTGKAVTLSPAFQKHTTKYTATVDYEVTSILIDAKVSNDKAKIESITGNENLKVGTNTISVIVVAENGKKANYRITVTRNEKPAEEPPTETETEEPFTPDMEVNGAGVQVTVPENVPTDFVEKTVQLAGGKEVEAYTLPVGNLTIMYLANESGAGAYYIYEAEESQVYPFVKLESDDNYVVVLKAKDTAAPEGYMPCTLSIEGKGVVTAYQLQTTRTVDATDFYLIYCMNNKGTFGWYQYDSVEGTYQRCTGQILAGGIVTPGNSEEPDNTEGGSSVSGQLQTRYEEMKNELQRAKMMLLVTLCAAAFIVVVLVIIIVVLLVRKRQKDDFDVEEEDDEVEFIDM